MSVHEWHLSDEYSMRVVQHEGCKVCFFFNIVHILDIKDNWIESGVKRVTYILPVTKFQHPTHFSINVPSGFIPIHTSIHECHVNLTSLVMTSLMSDMIFLGQLFLVDELTENGSLWWMQVQSPFKFTAINKLVSHFLLTFLLIHKGSLYKLEPTSGARRDTPWTWQLFMVHLLLFGNLE